MITTKLLEATIENLLREMKNRNIVNEIFQAKDVKSKFLEEKEEIKNPLQDFQIKMVPFIKRNEVPFNEMPGFLNKDTVVNFCMALLMTGTIDDDDIILDFDGMKKLLNSVDGNDAGIAEKFENFLYNEGRSFSEINQDELIKILLL